MSPIKQGKLEPSVPLQHPYTAAPAPSVFGVLLRTYISLLSWRQDAKKENKTDRNTSNSSRVVNQANCKFNFRSKFQFIDLLRFLESFLRCMNLFFPQCLTPYTWGPAKNNFCGKRKPVCFIT